MTNKIFAELNDLRSVAMDRIDDPLAERVIHFLGRIEGQYKPRTIASAVIAIHPNDDGIEKIKIEVTSDGRYHVGRYIFDAEQYGRMSTFFAEQVKDA